MHIVHTYQGICFGFGRYTPNDLAPPQMVAALINAGVPISTVQALLDSGDL